MFHWAMKGCQSYRRYSNEEAAAFQQLHENLSKHLQYIISELSLETI